MKRLLLLAALIPFLACAQDKAKAPEAKAPAKAAAPAPAPAAAPPQTAQPGTPTICDQTFSAITETVDHKMVSYLPGPFIAAQPYADVLANHEEQKKILKVLGNEQNKGGPYTITVAEVTACDGGPNVRVADGSLFVEGVTLNGMNKVAREMLKSADVIIKRYEDREKAGAKMAWNHGHAQNVERNDLGQVIPPGQQKKQ